MKLFWFITRVSEGAFSEPGQKTVIPARVVGKFSIRIVPNQTPDKVEQYVCNYIQKLWDKRGSPNHMKVSIIQLKTFAISIVV